MKKTGILVIDGEDPFCSFLKETLSPEKFELSFMLPGDTKNAKITGVTVNQDAVGAIIISTQTNGNSINTKSCIEGLIDDGFKGPILIKSVFKIDPTAQKLLEYGATDVIHATKIPEHLNELFA